MDEGIREYLIEMVRDRLGLEVTCDISDTIDEYVGYITDGIVEGYYASGNYVADCNHKEEGASNEKIESQRLKDELSMLYKAIGTKGLNLHFNNGAIYESGIEHVGGTISGSYTKKII